MTTPLLPPQHIESEQSVLGAMLLERFAVEVATSILHESDFYQSRHQMIYTAIRTLYHQQKPVDLITVGELLAAREQLEGIGGTLYLSQLMSEVPTAGGIRTYANTVRERAVRRRLITEAAKITDEAYNCETPIVEVLTSAESRVQTVTEIVETENKNRYIYDVALDLTREYAETVTKGEVKGLLPPWKGMSASHMLRPVCPGQLVVIAARPAMGKSAFLLNWVHGWAMQGHPGVLFSLEMESEEMTLRAMLREMQHTQDQLDDVAYLTANPSHVMADIGQAAHGFSGIPLIINDEPHVTLAKMRQYIRQAQRQVKRDYGKPLAWIGADFMQQMHADERARNRAEEVGKIAYGLAAIAKEFDVAVICLAQLNREVERESPKRPALMRYLEEAGKIEQAAHRILYLYRPGIYGPEESRKASEDSPFAFPNGDQWAEVGIIKQRGGRAGGRTILVFDGPRYTFRDLTREEIRQVRPNQ